MVPQIRKQGDEGRKPVWFGAMREKDERERENEDEECERKKPSMRIIGILFPFFGWIFIFIFK